MSGTSSPCISTATSASVGTCATTSSGVPSPMRNWRAMYSTRSELVGLTTGWLTDSVATAGARAAARKPSGSSTPSSSPVDAEDASTAPRASSSAT